MRPELARLEELGLWERLEDLGARFSLPFIPEYDRDYFSRLYHPELAAARDALAGETDAHSLSWRGRLKRFLGDLKGAEADLKAALDLEPGLAAAHAWLGELDLRRPEAEEALNRALALEDAAAWRLYRGAARLLHGRPAGAREDFRRALELAPAAGLPQLMAGLAEEASGRPREARAHYEAAAARNPGCSAAFLLASRAAGSGPEAWSLCEKAMDAEPTYALVTLSRWKPGTPWPKYLSWLRRFAFEEPERAAWYYRQEDIHYSPYQLEEYRDSSRLLAARPGAAWAGALVGRGALRCPPDAARQAAGRAALEASLASRPEGGWIYAWRALGAIKDGRPEDAVRDFTKAIELQPCYHRAYAWRGALLRKLGRLDEALADLDRSQRIDDEYGFGFHERSLARRAQGDWAGAALDLDRAFRFDDRYAWVFTAGREASPAELDAAQVELGAATAAEPHLASLWAWKGQLLLQRRRHSEALAALERACHLDPHHALAHAWLGRALIETGAGEAAAGVLARAVDLEPRTWTFSGWLAEAEFMAGRRRAAFTRIAGLLARRPGTWWALHLRGRLYLELGKPREALADLRAAIGYEGRHADGYYLEAQALLALGRAAEAEEAVGRALTVSPNLGRAYVLRASIRQALGRHADVLEDYRAVKEKFPYLLNEEQSQAVEALLEAAA